jgi:transcriptional regulator with XRE-family HTH domain
MGERMKARREYLRLTQQEIADSLDINRVTYAQYELGKNQIPVADLPRLAKVMRLTSVCFFFDEPESEVVEDADLMRYYNGLPPTLKNVARQQLKALFDAQDAEAK